MLWILYLVPAVKFQTLKDLTEYQINIFFPKNYLHKIAIAYTVSFSLQILWSRP